MSDALSQCITLELEERSAEEIASAYRALCCTLLLRTAMAARSKCPPRKVELDQKRTALTWAQENHGVISFQDACAALSMQPNRARKVILGYAKAGGGGAINMVRSRAVPRSKTHGTTDECGGEVPPVDGMDAGTSDAAGHRDSHAWA